MKTGKIEMMKYLATARVASFLAALVALPSASTIRGAESPGALTITPELHWGKLQLTWPNHTNTIYQIQKQSTVDGLWNNLVYISGDAPNLTFQDEHETASSQFYRVVAPNAPSLTTNLQKTLDSQRKTCGTKGACAVVITPDLTWVGTSGMSDPTTTNVIAPNMRLAIASCTKMFTAALILKLQEEGKLSISDPVSKWLPDIKNVTNTITIKQLLNHTSGVYDWYFNNSLFPKAFATDFSKFWTPLDTLSLIKVPKFKPGTSWDYSSMGFIVAGMVAEAAGGESLQDAWRRRFFEPLNLPSLWLRAREAPTGDIAHGFSGYFEPIPHDISAEPDTAIYSSTWSAAGLMASPMDMAYWTRALYSGEVLNADSMKQLTTMVSASGYGSGRYGLGTLEISTSNKGIFLGHFGDGWGFRCMMGHSTKLNSTVVFAINTEFGTEFTSWERMVAAWQALVSKL